MKKFNLFLLPLCATALLFAGCEKDNGTQDDDNSNVNSVGTFTQAAVIDAVADMYAAWDMGHMDGEYNFVRALAAHPEEYKLPDPEE